MVHSRSGLCGKEPLKAHTGVWRARCRGAFVPSLVLISLHRAASRLPYSERAIPSFLWYLVHEERH